MKYTVSGVPMTLTSRAKQTRSHTPSARASRSGSAPRCLAQGDTAILTETDNGSKTSV